MGKLFSWLKHNGILGLACGRPSGLRMTKLLRWLINLNKHRHSERLPLGNSEESRWVSDISSSFRGHAIQHVRRIPNSFRRPLIFGLTLLLVLLSTGIYEWRFAPAAKAAWLDEDWTYRQAIPISNAGSALTNYQISFTLDTAALITAGKLQADCDDLLLSDQSGNLLPYWVEENNPGCNNAATKIWAKAPSVPASTSTLYVYYGNPSAGISYLNDGDKVFTFYDDFENGGVKNSHWLANSWSNDATAFAGTLSGYKTAVDAHLTSTATYTTGVIEAEVRFNETNLRHFPIHFGHYILVANSNGHFAYYNGSAYVNLPVDTTYAADTWYKVVVKFNYPGDSYTVYIDGSDKGTVADNTNFNAASYGYIDLLNAAGGGAAGMRVDDIFLHQYAATEPAVTNPSTEEKGIGPIAHWKLDDGQGQTVQDSTTNNYDGTRGADASVAADDPALQTEDLCVSGKCLYFDGGDYVNVSSTLANARTISFWVRPTTTTASMINLSATAYITATTGTISAAGFTSATIYVNGKVSTTLAANTWQYITVTDTADINANAITLGKANAAYTTGFIDDIKIYAYARTASQIRSDYNAANTSKGASGNLSGGSLPGPQKSLSDGLVGYWKMDEASWTNDCTAGSVLDSSGNGNNGKACPNATGPTGGAAGKFGNGGYFDKVDDYVSAASVSQYSSSQSHSLEAWIKLDQTPTTEGTVIMPGDSSNKGTALTVGSNLKVKFYYQSGNHAVASTNALVVGTWYHIAASYDSASGNVKIYINGNLDGTGNVGTTTWAASTGLFIGRWASATYYFPGYMDDVRLYSRALSGDEVKNLYNYAPGPVGYWKMDESSWTNDCATLSVIDSSGQNNNGTSCPNTTGPTATTRGRYGRAGTFDGSDDYVATQTAYQFGSGNFTISLWLKTTTTDTVRAVLGTIDGGSNSLVAFFLNSNRNAAALVGTSFFQVRADGGGTRNVDFSTNIYDGNLHHIVLERTSDTATIVYVDGVAPALTVGANTLTGTINTQYPLTFGAENSRGVINNFSSVQMDDVKIYNYARTPDQIVEDMNAGKPAGASTIGSGANTRTDRPGTPVGYWKFDEGQGTSAKNYGSGGTALNGTLTNMAAPATTTSGWQASGKYGKALYFDGSNDVVSATSAAALDNNTTPTISAWINPTSIGEGSAGRIYDKGQQILQLKATNRLAFSQTFSTGTGTWETADNAITLSSWQHVAVVYDNSSASNDPKLYINGQSVAVTETAAPSGTYSSDAASTAYIGNDSTGAYTFEGQIDEVKVYRGNLTQDDIRTDMNAGASLKVGGDTTANQEGFGGAAPVAWWKMDEASWTNNCSTATVLDSSGNNNNGTACPNSTGPTGGAKGKIGRAGNFDGSDDYVDIGGYITAVDPARDYTISFWYKPNNNAVLFTQVRSGTDRFAIRTSYGNITAEHYNGTSYYEIGGGPLTFGQWYFVTYRHHTDQTRELYINGVKQGGGGDSYNPGSGASTFKFRSSNSLLDDVKIYDYIRTPSQIAYDYNRGLPIGWWKFNECHGVSLGDSSGNAATGTLNLAAGTITSAGDCATNPDPAVTSWYGGRDGKWNSSIKFDGTDDNVSIADNDRYTFGASTASTDRPMSLSVFTNLTDATSAGLISKYATNQREYQLYTDASDKLYAVVWDDSASAYIGRYYNTALTSTLEGAWHLITMTYDGSASAAGIKLYLDSKQIDDTDYTSGSYVAMENKTATVTLGKSDTSYANGQLDDARIYNYALTQAQIRTVLNEGGAVRYGPTSGAR